MCCADSVLRRLEKSALMSAKFIALWHVGYLPTVFNSRSVEHQILVAILAGGGGKSSVSGGLKAIPRFNPWPHMGWKRLSVGPWPCGSPKIV